MFKKTLFLLLIVSCGLCAVPVKHRMLSELEFIKGVFEMKYAPLKWKAEYAGFNLDHSVGMAVAEVEAMQKPSISEYHRILKRLFNSAKDYHVGINFYATESASLPFTVKGAEGRYFFVDIERNALPFSKFPFGIGDELVSFGGKPIGKVIEELKEREFGKNTEETDQALAELMLTFRLAENGDIVPKGSVQIEALRQGEKNPRSVVLNWNYIPEKVLTVPKPMMQTPDFAAWRMNPKEAVKKERFFDKQMLYANWQPKEAHDKHAIGARKSYIPALGRKLWTAQKDAIFDAYIFKSPGGENIGYIRIPHYMGDVDEVKEFCEVMRRFESCTDALVIDQINNPGGSVFYLYALVAALTDHGSVKTPKHRLMLTQEEVYMAISILDAMDGVTDVKQAKEIMGETLGGYPITMETVALMRKFCEFVLDEWAAGKLFTDLTHLFGVDQIKPHCDARYSKPILLLINSLDFSAGDFFPAIMQDAGRAKIMGTRTAGAGGYLAATQYPNQTAVTGFHLTASIAERHNKQPIENLGVRPDIEYQHTVYDMQNNYAEYVEKILESVEALL